MVSLVVVVEYISATRGVSVGQGSMTAEWGYPTRFTYVPEAGALPLSTMIEQLPRPERWLIGPKSQGHVRAIQVPSPRWKEELNEMGDPVLHWRVLDQTLLQQSSGR